MPDFNAGVINNAAQLSTSSTSVAGATTQSLQTLCGELHERIASFINEKTEVALLQRVQQQTKTALNVATEALSRYKLEELCMSYNGGKDCLVLLVVYLAALHTRFSQSAPQVLDSGASHPANPERLDSTVFPKSIKSVYIQPAHPFEEVDTFVKSSAQEYRLDLATSAKPMKAAFADYLEDHPEVKAIFVGTRRTDPHGGSLTHFDQTDRGWPSFMRIHPVIDWHYQEIWAFIRHLDIPYCPLYDLGYTSLGGTTDTHPNPKLAVAEKDPSGNLTGPTRFRPAYELQDDDEERLGRE